MGPDHVAIQKRGTPALFEQSGGEHLCGCGFARTTQAREPDAEAAPVARQMSFGKNPPRLWLHHPFGQRLSTVQQITNLASGYGPRLLRWRDFGDFFVAV